MSERLEKLFDEVFGARGDAAGCAAPMGPDEEIALRARYLAGALGGAERERFEKRLADDDGALGELEAARAFLAEADGVRAAEHQTVLQWRPRAQRLALAVGAAIAACLVIFVAIQALPRGQSTIVVASDAPREQIAAAAPVNGPAPITQDVRAPRRPQQVASEERPMDQAAIDAMVAARLREVQASMPPREQQDATPGVMQVSAEDSSQEACPASNMQAQPNRQPHRRCNPGTPLAPALQSAEPGASQTHPAGGHNNA
ncbi:MAG: hypothetical protein NW206_10580 [Hyphomonadaceae bacterium]|nr:hypothetical protein [Hyphomonadaceae bacterium]